MGNYRFKLSDLIPNSWLYMLKEKSKTRKNKHRIPHTENTLPSSPSSFSSSSISAVAAPEPHQKKSYYFTKRRAGDLNLPVEPPRKSSRRRKGRCRRNRSPRKLVSSSVSAGCSCHEALESLWINPSEEHSNSVLNRASTSDYDSVFPEYGSDCGLTTPDTFDGMVSWSTSCKCSADMRPFCKGVDKVLDQKDCLPQIITSKEDPIKIKTTTAEFSEESAYGSLSVKVVKQDDPTCNSSKDHHDALKKTASRHPIRRYSPNSPLYGVKLRTNSPRIVNRRISIDRKSSVGLNSSLAVMTSSKDPGRDFRESMVEMIVENNIRASSDLEELLACYLMLNSSEYHDLIINVFKQIWFDFLQK